MAALASAAASGAPAAAASIAARAAFCSAGSRIWPCRLLQHGCV